MGSQSRAGLEFSLNARTHFKIDAWQQVHREHGCLAEIEIEDVALNERDLVLDTCFLCILFAFRHTRRIEVHAHAFLGVEILDRRDHDPPVARTKIVNDVFSRDGGHFKYLGDDILWSRHERNVK